MGDSIVNIASGGAVVGAQIGKIVSSEVAFDSDWLGRLAELREGLSKARAAGDIDANTCAAAEAELRDATEVLSTSEGPSSSRFLIAMKKFRSLFDEASGIARSAAAIIDAVQNLR